MFFKFFTWSLVLTIVLWYFHEYHTVQFMMVFRNIPYLSPLIASFHTSSGHKEKGRVTTERLYILEELSTYDGGPKSKGIYIAILGKVFDVKKGEKHYGPGGTYHVFAGKDASRAFITGEFSSDLVSDDVIDLSLTDLLSLQKWQDFYETDYIYKGKLIGRYYKETGEKTEYLMEFEERLREAEGDQREKEDFKKDFPPCNVEWKAETGSRVWCTTRSGGVQRTWPGVPRKLYIVGTDKNTCVCINLPLLHEPNSPQFSRRFNLQEYQDCQQNSFECFF